MVGTGHREKPQGPQQETLGHPELQQLWEIEPIRQTILAAGAREIAHEAYQGFDSVEGDGVIE